MGNEIHFYPPNSKLLLITSDNREWKFLDHKMFEEYSSVQHYYILCYALIHGYSYTHRVSNSHGRFASWGKTFILQEMLNTHETVISLDSDVFFSTLSIPLEKLLNKWGFYDHPSTFMAMPLDPAGIRINYYDWAGQTRLALNAGFLIVKNTPRSTEVFREYLECDSEICKRLYNTWANEQATITSIIVPNLKQHEFVAIPCMEANGGLHNGFAVCNQGLFLTHRWNQKGIIAYEMITILQRYLFEIS